MYISVFHLYSYWITLHFIIYNVLNRFIKLPKYMSPYPNTLLGFVGQVFLTIRGWNIFSWSYLILTLAWKSFMFYYTEYDLSYETLKFNIGLLCSYIALMGIRGVNVLRLYGLDIMLTDERKGDYLEYLQSKISF